ncbi:NmrA family NAD(P)-binding protein [Paenibacillus sp. sgz500958]|uniref:NmrA family NAD(P)-binding protein n=1 Tax=Paenibacillus sp. sgz500958 TaxID=3242475 RepID=UPI0036D385BF
MSILITGASGKLGKLVIHELKLLAPSQRIVALVRKPGEAADALAAQGIEVRYGDYDLPETLESACAGVTKLLLISSSHSDNDTRIAQHERVISTAIEAGVQHLLYTSFAFPAKGPIPPGHVHLLTEEAIRNSGIPYTILRNSLYTDFVGALNLPKAVESGELVTYPGDWAFNSVIREDLAAATAAVLVSEGHIDKIYELTAPQTWDFEELCSVLSELTGQSIRHRQDEEAKSWLYGFLGSINTSAVSSDLEMLMKRQVTPLKASIRHFLLESGNN